MDIFVFHISFSLWPEIAKIQNRSSSVESMDLETADITVYHNLAEVCVCVHTHTHTRDGRFNRKKKTFFGFILTLNLHRILFTKPKSFIFVLSILSDHIQGNTVKNDF